MKSSIAIGLTLLTTLLISFNAHAQRMRSVEVDTAIVQTIKDQVWIPFMESYRDMDVQKLVSLHYPNITRVSIGPNRIETGANYLEKLSAMIGQVQDMNREMDITFSIVSSATSADKVYQTGDYMFSMKAPTDDEFTPRGYSSFSVLLSKDSETDKWLISLDADNPAQLTEEEFMQSGTIYQLAR